MKLNTIYNEDCLEGMKRIPDKSVDMILADLPYGMTACKWDAIIPFEPLWEQYERVIKDNGIIALFGSEPFSTTLRMSNSELYRYDWYWEKTKAGLYQHAKNRPMKAIETISIFSKAKWGHKSQVKNRMPYNPQGIRSIGEKTVTKNFNAGGIAGERPNQVGKKYEAFTGFPNDVLKFANVIGKQAIHPTQKPVALLEYLIKTYTNKGEIVLDNVMGVGSTAIACLNTDRQYIGFELDETYHKLSLERIENHTKELKERTKMRDRKELENLIDNAKYKENSETFQETLKRIKPFRNIKGNVKLKTLEKFIFEMGKRYQFRPQWITFTLLKDEPYYSLTLINTENHDHIGTVYGYSMYELFVKATLKIFYEIKVGNIKGVK